MTLRTCITCKVEQSIKEFYSQTHNKNWKRNTCKTCDKKRIHEWQKNNKAKKKSYNDKWVKNHPIRAKRTKWRSALKHKYNISLEEFMALKKEQDNRCAICTKKGKLWVDHCHTTNKIRGLLCPQCNTAIGLLEDNPDLIETARDYVILEGFRK